MAITYSAKGTSFPSFTIGKKGATVLQGIVAPLQTDGKEGDIYIQNGGTPALWQKVAGVWNKIGNFGSKIFTGTTSVDTAEEANRITINADGARIMEILKGAAVNGEKVEISNIAGGIKIETKDASNQDSVDLLIDLQGQGILRIQSDADSAIRTDDGSPITIEPGTTANGPGALTLKGGSTSKAATKGANVELIPGTGPAGMGQIVAPVGYTPTDPLSLITKEYLDAIIASLNP